MENTQFTPETRPEHCWDWITPEDVVKHALAAYHFARKECKPIQLARFTDVGGEPWMTRALWADTLTHYFDLRLKSEAYSLGFAPEYINEAKMLTLCDAPESFCQVIAERNSRTGGMGAIAPMASHGR